MASGPDQFELRKRDSSESNDQFDLDDSDFETQGLTSRLHNRQKPLSRVGKIVNLLPSRITKFLKRRTIWKGTRRRPGRSFLGCPVILGRRTRIVFNIVAGFIVVLLVFTAIF